MAVNSDIFVVPNDGFKNQRNAELIYERSVIDATHDLYPQGCEKSSKILVINRIWYAIRYLRVDRFEELLLQYASCKSLTNKAFSSKVANFQERTTLGNVFHWIASTYSRPTYEENRAAYAQMLHLLLKHLPNDIISIMLREYDSNGRTPVEVCLLNGRCAFAAALIYNDSPLPRKEMVITSSRFFDDYTMKTLRSYVLTFKKNNPSIIPAILPDLRIDHADRLMFYNFPSWMSEQMVFTPNNNGFILHAKNKFYPTDEHWNFVHEE